MLRDQIDYASGWSLPLETELDGKLHVELLARTQSGRTVEIPNCIVHLPETTIIRTRERCAPMGGEVFIAAVEVR